MKNLFRTFCFCSIGWFLACGATARAADTQTLGTPAGSMAVPTNLTAQQVQDALIKAADGRGWTLVSREDEKVIIRLDKGDWSSRIVMIYNTKEVQFFSNTTKEGKPKLPASWLKYLKEDSLRIMNATAVLKS